MKKKIIKSTTDILDRTIYYAIIETAIGWVGIAEDENGLIRLILPESSPENIWEDLSTYFYSEKKLIRKESRFTDLIKKIRDYFMGKQVEFDEEKLNLSVYTPFQRRVLLKAREIPYGITRTYRWLAEQSGFPRAYRATGGVMKMNPLPLIIPCHRVIGSNGHLTGFSSQGGVELKRRMLTLEGVIIEGK